MNNKLVVILGPTASGKTDSSIKLAKKFGGEIVSADSRQVYKGLNIGSGKITKKEMGGIRHHLLNVASPARRFTVAQYQKLAAKAIKNILQRGKIPFLVGGTGFYIQSIVDGIVIPNIKPSRALRARLSKKTVSELFSMLKKLDPERAKTIDAKNPRRLIRALEIVITTGQPVPPFKKSVQSPTLHTLQIGIKKSPRKLKRLIAERLIKRLPGIIKEVKNLHKNGLSWKRLEELGLEYRFAAQFLKNKISRQEMVEKIQIESEHFAKRQMTWFKRDQRIHWIKSERQAENLIKKL